MKILIAYDGSECADDALHDLKRAGLPDEVDVLVSTISDIWIPNSLGKDVRPPRHDRAVEVQHLRTHAAEALHTAHEIALKGAERLRELFPTWSINARAYADSPAWGILDMAHDWEPDLIVLGSHGHSALHRLMLGSVSLKVLSEATCSVRIARGRNAVDDSPVRIVVGVDGSEGSRRTVQTVASRRWPAQSSVQVVAVVEPFAPVMAPPLGSHVPVVESEVADEVRGALERELDRAARTLGDAGLHVQSMLGDGKPDRVLLDEAKRWGADCIFVGAQGHRFLERILLGSVSSALATHAHCSVEVVR